MTRPTSTKRFSRIMAVDPGLTTGVAIMKDGDVEYMVEVPGGAPGFNSWWLENSERLRLGSMDAYVIEDYVSDGSTRSRVWSSEVIGVMIARIPDDAELRRQLRSDKSGLFNQERSGDAGEPERFEWLEGHGIQSTGKGHDLDAVTHALVFAKGMRDIIVYRKFWA